MHSIDEIAAILYPLPEPGEVSEEVLPDVIAQVTEARQDFALKLEAAFDEDPEANDPLLSALREAHARKEAADAQIRLLFAYGRRFARPRPYRLRDLAAASGMTNSGVSTAYAEKTITAVEAAIGRAPREPADPA